jgi:glycosyltransferase involved in cell wall biosynthesis
VVVRILMLVPHSGVRGPIARIVELLIPALREFGCETETVPWGRHTDEEGLTRKLVGRPSDALHVRRVIGSRPRPDAIVVQTSHDWRSVARDLVLVSALARGGPPIVLQWHGSRADLVAAKGHRVLKRATLLLLGAVRGALVLSSEERAAFESLAPGARLEVVVNPFVPLAGAGTRDGGAARSETAASRLLFTARLLPEKGVFDVLDALALLVRRGRRADLVVAGAGSAEPELRRRIAAHRLESHVTLVGHLPQPSLAREYAEADVFVFPTYHPVEGFPTVIAEAMGAGLPIVTTRMRGITDHLRDGVNALLVPARDPEAVATAVERLLVDGELRGRMRDANREAVRAFAPEPVARAYLEALHRVVDG